MAGIEETMHEFKHGTLHSGSKKGPVVTSRAQAIAIGLSEERAASSGKKRKRKTDGERVMGLWSSDREFSAEKRKSLAKSGKAMAHGGFPIENEGDLKNAIKAFGRAGNKSATKAHIKKRAKALGKTNLLPENWDAAKFTEDRELYDEWIAAGDAKVCPACKGDGVNPDDETDECDVCNGEGYVGLPASLEDRRPRDDDDDDDDDDDVDDAWSEAAREAAAAARHSSSGSRKERLRRRKEGSGKHSKDREFRDSVELIVDKGQLRKTKDGYLVCSARIARTGIQLYDGSELGGPPGPVRVYRPPDEVFSKAAMQSLAHKPITLDHPPEMVDSNNWDQYAIGHVGDEVTRDGDTVRVPMVIMDGKAIQAYERDGVKQLSVGYSTELKWGKGRTPNGEAYDAKQTSIRGNHLAVVPAARGGMQLSIGDDQQKGADMVKVLIDGQSIEFENELAAQHVQRHLASLHKALDNKHGGNDDDDEEEEREKKERGEKDAAFAALKGENAALKKQLEDANAKTDAKAIDAQVKERMELLLKADALMEGKGNFDGKDDAAIRREVVLAKMGDAGKLLNDAEMVGAFKYLAANVKPRSGTDRLADSLAMLGQGGGNNNSNPKALRDAAYGEYVTNLSNAWRKRPTA